MNLNTNLKEKDEKVLSYFIETTFKKFLNHIMKEGKKATAEKVLRDTFANMQKNKTYLDFKANNPKENIYTFYVRTMINLKPLIELKKNRLGRKVYLVPFPVKPARQLTLGFRELLNHARKRDNEKKMSIKLANELSLSYEEKSPSCKKLRLMYEEAYDNKAYSHYRWY